MRTLDRNRQTFYYANYQGKTYITDSSGYKTGEYTLSYSTPVAVKANISPATGNAYTDLFGVAVDCDKVIVYDDPTLDIANTSILWVDDTDTDNPHDYIVKRIARSLNSISIAIKKVDVVNG